MNMHYGKLPATRLAGVRNLSDYATGRLPAPPASVPAPKVPLPMDGNDKVGDCVMAGTAHLLAAWNFIVHTHDAVPSETAVVNTYFELTGGQDSGLNEQTVLETWRTEGLFDYRIAAYAPVDHSSIVELHQAIAFYGGAMLGIACPESAQEQFASGSAWTYVAGSPVEGGHCIVALGYTHLGLLCATWGGIAEVTYPFLSHYLDEAWACIPNQYAEHNGDGRGIDLKALQADLDGLAA